ncbi:hypothetical protein [Mycobacterium sp.]|uniref:hypothetical protein n=1 Tax=Mycobacterium sp. TaxID=1785 RepID=UPI003F9DAB63
MRWIAWVRWLCMWAGAWSYLCESSDRRGSDTWIEYNLDTAHSIPHVRPESPLEQDDFVKLANAVDPHIEATCGLAGLIIEGPGVPGMGESWVMSTTFALFEIITSA